MGCGSSFNSFWGLELISVCEEKNRGGCFRWCGGDIEGVFVQAGKARLTFWIDSEGSDRSALHLISHILPSLLLKPPKFTHSKSSWCGCRWDQTEGKLPLGDNVATIVNTYKDRLFQNVVRKSEASVSILGWSIVKFWEVSIGSSGRLKVFSWTRLSLTVLGWPPLSSILNSFGM